MQIKLELVCHPATPPTAVDRVYALVGTIAEAPEQRFVAYHVHADAPLHLPPPVVPSRTDELWKTTCFELFIKPRAAEGYIEFNLSPSFAWAAYRFERYRRGVSDLPLAFDPGICLTPTDGRDIIVEADIDVSAVNGGEAQLGVSAVIEELDGTKSYWALSHAPGPPDFHNPACFIATLPAPERP